MDQIPRYLITTADETTWVFDRPIVFLGFCYNNFLNIKTHIFVNHLFVSNIDDLIENYRASTFYDKKVENKIHFEVKGIISRDGHFHIQKNSKIIIASVKK